MVLRCFHICRRESIKTPVVVVSPLTIEGADEAIKSLELGAFDFVHKTKQYHRGKGETSLRKLCSRVVYAAVRITHTCS